MWMFCLQLFVIVIISIGIAILISKQIDKEKREKCCPYCCCREHCRIGQNVEQKCSDRELKPFVCGGNF